MRTAGWVLGGLLSAFALTHADRAEAEPEPPLSARMDCRGGERLIACVVSLDVPLPSYVSYGDVRIVSTPSFARPILSRAQYIKQASTRPLLKLALVPKGEGVGKVVVKVRAIICKDKPYCPTVTRVLSTDIRVPEQADATAR